MNPFLNFYAAPPGLLEHAAVLAVLGPILAAPAAAIAPNSRWAWMIAVAASAFSFWMALGIAGEVAREGAISYQFGGFPPPLGIEFRIDAVASLFLLLISGVGMATAVFSGHSVRAEIRAAKRGFFQAGFLLCLAGLMGMAATGDAFNAFVFLEISAIGTYALIGIGDARDRRALPAAFNYLIMGTVGATFFVVGVGFLYAATGTLNMADIAERLTGMGDSRVVQAGFAFIVVGLGIKAAIFPLHGWLPAAYSHAPSVMNVFLSATATKAAIYLMCRFIFDVFGVRFDFVEAFLHYVLAPLAAAAALICSAQAIFQTELRRMLAFSTVAQVGFVFLGAALGSPAGVAAALLHLSAQVLIKAGLFMAVGGLATQTRAVRLDDFAGSGRQAPWTMTAFAISAFSLAGIPLTLGFLSKFRLIEAAASAGEIWIVAALALGSVLSIIYIGRIMEVVFFRMPSASASPVSEAPLGALLPLWALAGASLWLGVAGGWLEALTRASSAALLGVTP